MTPNAGPAGFTGVLSEHDEDIIITETKKQPVRKYEVMWPIVVYTTYLQLHAAYGLFLMLSSAKLATSLLVFMYYIMSMLGVTAGSHRLWSHKSYKAKWPLKLILAIFHTMSFQNTIIHWAKDHRLHHKYSETDGDPHNAARGFFYSHIGWLLVKKHPDVLEKGKQLDVSDLLADPILVFQKRYYLMLVLLICFITPISIPMYFWGETFRNAFGVNLFRYVLALHATWFVNSIAHQFGNKPYDKYLSASESDVVKVLTLGEGYHNFHHVFPWDSQVSELGKYDISPTRAFISLFAKIGWAYDLKSVSLDLVKRRVGRNGDGSHHLWGWGDRDQPNEDYDGAVITQQRIKNEIIYLYIVHQHEHSANVI